MQEGGESKSIGRDGAKVRPVASKQSEKLEAIECSEQRGARRRCGQPLLRARGTKTKCAQPLGARNRDRAH
eukprot:3775859-Pleurochrysis_carterae.AAC.1